MCSQCRRADSLEHTFLDCPVSIKFYEEIISWFNQKSKTKITLSNEELLFQNYELPLSLPPLSRCQLNLLVLLAKKYLYACKFTDARPDYSQLVIKLQDQWKIEHLSSAPTHLLLPRFVSLQLLFTCISFHFVQVAIPYILLCNIQSIPLLHLLNRD